MEFIGQRGKLKVTFISNQFKRGIATISQPLSPNNYHSSSYTDIACPALGGID